MKKYYKNQYTGNENGWHEPIVTLGETHLDEMHLNELNSQFRNSGIKYEDKSYSDEYKTVTTNQADHGEPNLVVDNGKLKATHDKAGVKAANVKKESEHKGQQPAKPTAADAFVKSDGEVKHAEIKDDGKQPNINTTAGN